MDRWGWGGVPRGLRNKIIFFVIFKIYTKNSATFDFDGDGQVGGGVVCREASVIKLYFLLFLKYVLCFLEMISTGGFITPTASENRFPLAVLSYPPVKIMIPTDP
jgi:hypothetical protein